MVTHCEADFIPLLFHYTFSHAQQLQLLRFVSRHDGDARAENTRSSCTCGGEDARSSTCDMTG